MAQISQTRQAVTSELLADGREALLAGDRPQARALLKAVLGSEPDNVEAWLWLAGAHVEPVESENCLRRALEIDPGNEQALEGLAWLASRQPAPSPPAPTTTSQPAAPAPTPAPAREDSVPRIPVAAPTPSHPRVVIAPGSISLLEGAVQVMGVGALLGLLRLAGSLRPETLLLIRTSGRPLGAVPAIAIAGVAALLHALVLLVVWGVLSHRVSLARSDRRGDYFDSLLRTASIFVPGYFAGASLALTLLTLGWSQRRWMPVAVVVWVLLGVAAALIGRRGWELLRSLRLPIQRRAVYIGGIAVPVLLVAVAGLGLAGSLVRALLAAL